MDPSRAIRLWGTEEAVEAPVVLAAGELRAEFSGGNLRYIRVGGREVLRAIAFLIRDGNWGTYNPVLSNLRIASDAAGFTVGYDAEVRDAAQSLRWSARIAGRADGSLSFAAEAEPLTDFVTNRAGFVVLHPLEGIVGAPVTVEHTDGRKVESRFPALIDPSCPFLHVRALTHTVAPGLRATCRTEGDAFETEDHRNWMDASYKTYVRPLALPWPYTLPKGTPFRQSVSLSLDGGVPAAAGAADAPVAVTIGAPLGHAMPEVGLAVPPEHAAAALARADLLRAAAPAFLVCHFDARKGHGDAAMAAFRDLGAATGAALVLEAVIACEDAAGKPSADPAILARDMGAVRDAALRAGVAFARVAVSPAADLKCTLPGSVFPPAPSWAELFAAARRAFPGTPVGGGMFSYFTELNRKRPPAGLPDFIGHSGCPLVHAGDDVSMLETLEALPSIFASTRAFGGGRPYLVFPTAIAMRDNPYGAAPAENPGNLRQAMNRVDPRERGIAGAAWYAGYLAHAARAGVEGVTLAAVAGPSGIVNAPLPEAQPGYDGTDALVCPSWHAIAAHAALRGASVLAAESARPGAVQALAARQSDGLTTVVITNLTGAPVRVAVRGVSGPFALRRIDAEGFPVLCRGPGGAGIPAGTFAGGELLLDACAVAILEG